MGHELLTPPREVRVITISPAVTHSTRMKIKHLSNWDIVSCTEGCSQAHMTHSLHTYYYDKRCEEEGDTQDGGLCLCKFIKVGVI